MGASVVVLVWELSIPGCRSLKEKRTVLRSLTDRMKNRFNLSVAETDYQNVHERAQITAALVTSDGRQAESLSDRVDRFVAEDGRLMIVSFHRERV